MRILVTGGAGFIGSHTCLLLLEKGYELVVVDSFINSSKKVYENILKILSEKRVPYQDKINTFEFDLRDKQKLDQIFNEAIQEGNPISAAIHFAGLKSVSESIISPIEYWDSNVIGSINLIKIMEKYKCRNLVFSSSASIYKSSSKLKISEDDVIQPITPYGQTKAAIEYFLTDLTKNKSSEWKIANLRYFNPISSHPSGLLQENPSGTPNNIFPLLKKVALGKKKEFHIFGNDWPTHDGTAIRDYIHVMDLAEAHINVLEYIILKSSLLLNLNVGTGIGTTVLELIKVFEQTNRVKVPYVFTQRRDGDLGIVIADNAKITRLLNWSAERSIKKMCKDGWAINN